MIIVCPSCQAKYKFDEEKLGERPRAKTRCAKCGGTIEIENPLLAAMTLPPGTMAGASPQVPTVEAPAPELPDATPPPKKPAGPPAGTVTGRGLENSIGFLEIEGQVLADRVGSWFQYLFWAVGAFSLFAAALGIVDYTSRLAADVIKTSYARNANESKVYAGLVWGLVLIGIAVLLAGFSQPIVLLVIAAVVGGFMMFIYSGLLILINRKILPEPIRVRGLRLVMLIWAIALFGTLSALTFRDQLGKLFGG